MAYYASNSSRGRRGANSSRTIGTSSKYNALIKSMLVEENGRGKVTGKLLLTDLNLVPPTWTMLFRGKYLSREVNIAKLLCSQKDPIIIYKGIVKLPGLQTNNCFSRVVPSEENGEKLTQKNRESLEECKTDKNEAEIGAKVVTKSNKRITETYKVLFLKGNEEDDKEKMAFVNTAKRKLFFEKSGDGHPTRRKNRQKLIEARSSDTVDTFKQRICAAFKVDPEKHIISYNDSNLVDSDKLESHDFTIGSTITLDFKRVVTEELKKERKDEVERLRKKGLIRQRNEELHRQMMNEEVKRKREEKKLMMKRPLTKTEKLEQRREAQPKRETRAQLKTESLAREKHSIPKYKRDELKRLNSHGGGGPSPRVQSSFSAQNVERRAIAMEGETPTYQWNLYSFGMTLYGTCSNEQCISRKKKFKNGNGVSNIAGYGNIILTLERIKFPCSACKELFPVKEFVLCSGRALFRFKKSGVGEPVKTVVIESEGDDLMKYKTFDKLAEGEEVEMSDYDFIEITTVKLGFGLYTCVKCDEMIRFKQDENVLREPSHP